MTGQFVPCVLASQSATFSPGSEATELSLRHRHSFHEASHPAREVADHPEVA
jgi:hypothetical protein